MQIQEWDGNGVFGTQVLWPENEARRSGFNYLATSKCLMVCFFLRIGVWQE